MNARLREALIFFLQVFAPGCRFFQITLTHLQRGEHGNEGPVNEKKTAHGCNKNTLLSIELPLPPAHSRHARETLGSPLTPLFSVLATENR
jgi:hypothetical protein